ncbi:RNA-guided endonuclease TnpB family protein [Bacillus toyonensis]|uniref:RNA-guided endonuclease TnpB family protein n=1 Tax=Bacillus toyonensis TaxID=155322 RepID=UPI001EDD016F|nr:RNA-guided endonuclease TnpB family protein [Bacillus toyonensis]MCG3795981.1 RNA-guided endonuclease TnpB family protein [Bacillus toyonensis]
MITSRKIRLSIVSDNSTEAYNFIRKEMREQNKALNVAMNHLYFNYVARQKISFADKAYQHKLNKAIEAQQKSFILLKELEQKQIVETDSSKKSILKERLIKSKTTYEKTKEKLSSLRKARNKELFDEYNTMIGQLEETHLRDIVSSQFNLLSDTKDRLTKIAYQDFKNDITEVLSGDRSLRTYKKNNPLYIRGRTLNLFKESEEFFIKWTKKIVFKCVLGVKYQNKTELYKTLECILTGEYTLCDSSMNFNQQNKLILNLALNIPEKSENRKVPGRIAGIDLGLKIPAYFAVNDVPYIRKALGKIEDFLKVRTNIQSQKRSLQRALQSSKGGKGRKKKLKALDQFKEKEKNYITTYNHFISKKIISLAVQYGVEQINLELLTLKETQKKSLLRNWSYYQLQQFIEYKANREEILIKYVDPFHTSQTCSKCGHYEDGQREKQDTFCCKSCGFIDNADYNAARNIAASTRYITNKEESEYYRKNNNEIA